MTSYSFGHTRSAEDRLRILASVYEDESAAFLREWSPATVDAAIDIACGPGHTTALVARTTSARRVYGLDISPDFVRSASAEYGAIASFSVHDITEPPLPGAPADLIFARLIVTHLPSPADAVATWAAALRPGGRLLLDEVEAIDVPDATCARYLEIAAGVVAVSGGELYIGPTLGSFAPSGAAVPYDGTVECPVTARAAASMFRLNIPNWSATALAHRLTTEAELGEIAARLDAMAEGRLGAEGLVWWMRHVVVRGDVTSRTSL